MSEEQNITYDVDGGQELTDALMNLLNECPLLALGEGFQFSELETGLSMYPTSGAIIQREKHSITDHISQECNYPFVILYRLYGQNSSNKITIKEFMDSIGKWLEKEPVKVGETYYQLTAYPTLTEGRIIKTIKRQTPAYLEAIEDDQAENWVIALNATYTREYDL